MTQRYDRRSVQLHWAMAVLLGAQIALGLWMVALPKDDSGVRAAWFNVHKSLGMVLLLLATVRAARLAWRPVVAPAAAGLPGLAARAAHGLLYLLMLVAPLSGFLASVYSPYPIRLFGLQLPRLAEPWGAARDLLSALHLASVYALLALVALHVLAFAYHQLVLKDGLLQRMR